ncbi:MAG: HAD-IA family hydrolase [Phycisphaerales bacterium]
MNTLELVIFDIAGTSVKDTGFVEHAFLSVSDRHQLGLDAAWIKPRMGVHKLAVMREALEQSGKTGQIEPEQLSGEFEIAIDEQVNSGSAPALPGFMELFHDLQHAGIKVAFTTGFSRKTAERVLAGAGINYETLVASDEVDNGRPAPDVVLEAMRRAGVDHPYHVAVIGDTPSDLGSGMNAEAAVVIGVGHGTHTLGDLQPHPHTHLAADMGQLRDILSTRTSIPACEPAHG